MNGSQPAAQALMACLGEESRFRLVQALMGGARCVTDLAMEVGLSQSCTTRHLQALERRQVVRGTRYGKRVLYRIREEDPGLMPLLGWALRSHTALDGGPRVDQAGSSDRVRPAERDGPGDPARRAEPARPTRNARSRPTHRRPLTASERVSEATETATARADRKADPIEPGSRPQTRPEPPQPRRGRASDIEDFLL